MYELAGPVAEKYDLDEINGLDGVIAAFTKNKAILAPGMLPEIEIFTKGEIKKEQSKVTQQIGKLLYNVCLPSEARHIEKALDRLAIEYVWKEFGAKYDELSPEMFLLERTIEAKSDDGHNTAQVNIPLFASAPIIGNEEWKIIKEWHSKDSYTTYKATITSKIPPIAREAKEKAKQAGADFLEAYSNALKEPMLGDLIIRKGIACSLDMKLYWIPTPSELKVQLEVREKDPLIVAQLYGKHFLVAKWNVEGEEPFEHYLAEYKVR